MTTYNAGQRLTGAQLNAIVTDADEVLNVVKTANQTVNNSAVLVDDSELFIPVAALTTYVFTAMVLFTSGTTPDIKYGFTFPALATCQWGSVRLVSSASPTGDADFGSYSSATSGTSVVAAAGTGGDQIATVMGTLVVGATSGTLRLQWAQNTATASNTVVYLGSYLTANRV